MAGGAERRADPGRHHRPVQTRQALRRNYPILAHFRYFFESIRPEIRQYFLEDDTDAKPFSRNQRSIVYQRAKVETDKRPFGTQLDVYQAGYEWINHSIRPAPTRRPQLPHRDRQPSGLPARPALQGQRLQHFGDELRRAVGQCDPGAERRRAPRRLHARHRRRQHQPLPPRKRRRPGVGNRLRLLRLPQ